MALTTSGVATSAIGLEAFFYAQLFEVGSTPVFDGRFVTPQIGVEAVFPCSDSIFMALVTPVTG